MAPASRRVAWWAPTAWLATCAATVPRVHVPSRNDTLDLEGVPLTIGAALRRMAESAHQLGAGESSYRGARDPPGLLRALVHGASLPTTVNRAVELLGQELNATSADLEHWASQHEAARLAASAAAEGTLTMRLAPGTASLRRALAEQYAEAQSRSLAAELKLRELEAVATKLRAQLREQGPTGQHTMVARLHMALSVPATPRLRSAQLTEAVSSASGPLRPPTTAGAPTAAGTAAGAVNGAAAAPKPAGRATRPRRLRPTMNAVVPSAEVKGIVQPVTPAACSEPATHPVQREAREARRASQPRPGDIGGAPVARSLAHEVNTETFGYAVAPFAEQAVRP